MIDTIVLTSPIHHFKIIDSSRFQPDAMWIHSKPYIATVNGIRKCVQNPTKEDEKSGIYKPRLTLTRRWDGYRVTISLRMEFSIPKLLYGNSFDELSDHDFPAVVRTLYERLADMGVRMLPWKLEQAIVSVIHYGKNIVLSDYTSIHYVLSRIAKTNISHCFDTARTDYANGWELFRLHTKSFQIVLYDKIADLRKTKDRAIEKGMRGVNYQMSLFDDLRDASKRRHESFEVLRMEIRFLNKAKLRSVFRTLKMPFADPFTFHAAFDMEHAQRIVACFWDTFAAELRLLAFLDTKPVDRVARMIQCGWHEKTPTKLLALAMLAEMVANEDYRSVRKQFESIYDRRTLARLSVELREFQGGMDESPFVSLIDRALERYEPLKIWKFQYTGVHDNTQ